MATLAATRAELTKIRTLRSAWLVLGAILCLQLIAETPALGLYTEAVSEIAPDGTIEIFDGEREPARAAILDGLTAASLQMSVFLPVLAAVMAGQEFHSRQLGLSVLAVPRRGRLVVAKSLAAAAALLVASLLIAAVSTTFTYLAIADWEPRLLLTPEAVTRQTAFLGYAVLLGLASYAVTVLARSTLVGVLANVALSAVAMSQALAASPAVDALLPVSAGRNLLLDPALGDLTSGPTHAAAVLVGWALVATVAAAVVIIRADVR